MLLPLVGCTPDSFSYGSGGEAQACDGDACSEACPVGSHAVEGVCVFECGAWDVTEPQAAALGLALGSDRLYVVGSANEDAGRPALGWLTALSACTGSEDAAALVGNSAAEVAARPIITTSVARSSPRRRARRAMSASSPAQIWIVRSGAPPTPCMKPVLQTS